MHLRLRLDRVGRALWRALPIAAALVTLGIMAAACGGGSASPGVASVGTSTSTTTPTSNPSTTAGSSGSPSTSGGGGGLRQSSMSMAGVSVEFSECMQKHGEPNFPDPNGSGQITATGINPNSSQFQAAQRACAKYSPNGGKAPSPAQQQKMVAQALKFSQCMRSHGLSDFPDPQVSSAGGAVRIGLKISDGGSSSDLNRNNPTFQKAQAACQGLMQLPGSAKAGTDSLGIAG